MPSPRSTNAPWKPRRRPPRPRSSSVSAAAACRPAPGSAPMNETPPSAPRALSRRAARRPARGHPAPRRARRGAGAARVVDAQRGPAAPHGHLGLAARGPRSVGRRRPIPQLLPALPRWDAAAADGGALSFVVEVAGGAVNALVRLDGASGLRTSLTAHRPFASFSGPRFVRGAAAGALPAPSPGAPGAVSAVVDNATAVVLEAAAAGGASVEHPIGECIDVVVLAGSPGPTAVCKRVAPGASRGGALPGTCASRPAMRRTALPAPRTRRSATAASSSSTPTARAAGS